MQLHIAQHHVPYSQLNYHKSLVNRYTDMTIPILQDDTGRKMFYRKDDDDDAMSGELNERFSHEIPQENSFRGQSYGKKVLT